jgi:diguanylate cyclase (GGDEF)-like protein
MTNRGEFLERVVRLLSEVMKFDKVYLFLRETRNGPLQLRAYSGKNIGEKAIRDVVGEGRGLTGKAIRTGEAVFCNDISKDPVFYMDDERTLSEAVLPIRSGDHLWGVLVVDEYSTGAFEQEEREQLRILAGITGVVLDNMDNLARIKEDLDLMERLHGIIASVAGERDIRTMCRETVRLLNLDTRYSFVQIHEVNCEKTGESKIIAGSTMGSIHGEVIEKENALLREGGWGLVGEAVRKKRLLNVPDVRKSKIYVLISPKTRSELDVPIEFDGKIYGVLSVESELLHAFQEEDERVISILARHLGALWAHNELLERTERQAMQDPLTALWNRRFFFDRLDAETSRCVRYDCIFSIVMIDLRNFKIVNDRFGHPAGDRVLIEIASFFQRSVRECDVVARYGGDEFVILFPETDFAEASRIMGRVEENLKNQKLCVESVEVLFDCGIASFPSDGKDGRALVQAADERLYKGKTAGKNNRRGEPGLETLP